MVSVLLAAYFFLAVSVVALSFLYTYILSRRFERYAETRSRYFILGLIFGALGVALLIASAALRPEALAPGSKVPLTYMHAAGEALLLVTFILIYTMILRLVSFISGKKVPFPYLELLFISVFMGAAYYSLSLLFYTPLDGFLISMDFVCAVDALLLFALCLKREMEISRRIAIESEPYIYPLLFFLAYHMFYQVHAFLTKVMPVALSSAYADTANAVRIVFTVIPVVITIAFCYTSLKKITGMPDVRKSVGDQKRLIPFLDEVSQLIGESTMTIYRYGMEDYRKTFPGEKENDELYQYLVRYFEDYIGPVSARIAREIETGERNGARLRTGPYKDN